MFGFGKSDSGNSSQSWSYKYANELETTHRRTHGYNSPYSSGEAAFTARRVEPLLNPKSSKNTGKSWWGA